MGIQSVIFLKFTEVPTTEFQLFSTNPELQIWQPCKNHGCHVKTDFIFGFCIKKLTRINGFGHLSVFLNMKKIKETKKKLSKNVVFSLFSQLKWPISRERLPC